MGIESAELIWLEQHELTLTELADLSGLPQSTLEELLDCGAIVPLSRSGEIRFGATALNAARTARRLQADFELDLQALMLALGLLDRIADLQAELQTLRARLPPAAHP